MAASPQLERPQKHLTPMDHGRKLSHAPRPGTCTTDAHVVGSWHGTRVSALLMPAAALPNHHQSQLRDLGEPFV
jgi:hypothetical protein